MGQFLWSGVSARPWNVAVDRFAREIVAFLKSSHSARSRQLNAKPLGGNHHSLWLMPITSLLGRRGTITVYTNETNGHTRIY
jgi:hypothetical protein